MSAETDRIDEFGCRVGKEYHEIVFKKISELNRKVDQLAISSDMTTLMLSKIDCALNGNGVPGLKTRVDRVETSAKLLWIVFVFLVGTALTLFGILYKAQSAAAQDAPWFEPGEFESYEGSGLYNIFPTHRNCEQNFYHCSLNNFQLWMELGQCKPSTPSLECSDFQDGAGSGLLWKPVSENTGNPVLLFPGDYWEATDEILIQNSAGETLTKAKPRTCCPNGGRAHYDLTVRASSLPKDVVVVVKFNNGNSECFNVTDPEKRYD